ncbi:MAG TPA: hypothetical protein VK627_02970 [Edaphobacter sp.]|jgi:hypothetical protein|nr:hypothetical protein [Edaphobacter sp.]
MTDSNFPDFDTMTPADFEKYLPDFFANGDGHVSSDPRLQTFLANNPDCAALVRDLETIAEHAKSLFEPSYDPSDTVWSNIQSKLNQPLTEDEDPPLAHAQ